MTITQLEYVIAVDKHRHFGRAAEACFITQPTLSMQIQKLEDMLGVLIFDRSKKPVETTEVGKKIVAQALQMIDGAKKIENLVAEAKNEFEGIYRLGIIPTLAPYLLHRFIKPFKKAFPKLSLHVEELQTEQIIAKLAAGDLDSGLLATPLSQSHLVEIPLYYEPFMAYIPEQYPMHKDEFILASELADTPVLLLGEGHCFRNSVLKICNNHSENYNHHFYMEAGNFETLVRLSKKGLGITLIPYLMAIEMNEQEKNSIKPIAEPKPTREISLVHAKTHHKLKIAAQLTQMIQSSVPEKLWINTGEVVKPV